MPKIHTPTNPERRAAQLYDLLMDEMRAFQPSQAEGELALCMALAAYISGTCNSDSEAAMTIKRLGNNVEFYYEACKKHAARQKDEERIQIDLDS